MKRSGWFALLVAVLLAVPAGDALAGVPVDPNLGDDVLGRAGGLRYASETEAFDAGNSGYAAVEVGCGGPRWHLLGGGSQAGGAVDQAWHAFGRPYDFDDADDTGDDGWYTGGFGPDADPFTGYSICVRDGTIRYRFHQIGDDPSGERSGSIGCGNQSWEVTSGSPFIATTGSWTSSSFPKDGGDADHRPDDGWGGRAFDQVGGLGGFYLYAVCTRDQAVQYVDRGPRSVAAGEAFGRRVGCGHGEHVVGGGAEVSGPAERSRLVSSFPYDGGDGDHAPDDGWQIRVYNVSGADKDVTTFAICLG